MRIALLGYGKMGKTIEHIAQAKGHDIVVRANSSQSNMDLSSADVAIEFSVPDAAVANIISCFEQGVPVVSGTTGWLDRYDEILNICEERNGSFIYASNFSIELAQTINTSRKGRELLKLVHQDTQVVENMVECSRRL